MNKIDIRTVRAQWLNQCGSCDAGLPMTCTCPDDDPRNVIHALVEHLEDLYNNYDMLMCSTMGDAVDRALSREHIVQVSAADTARLREWIQSPNGSFVGARYAVEAVEGGGVLVRTLPHGGLDSTTS